MNQGTTRQYEEFIFRRLTEPISLFGMELPGDWSGMIWGLLLIVVLLIGFTYVGIMYLRDSRGVGPWWSIVLGLLRAGVYGVIAFIFLLPSRQSWEEKTSSSKVIVLFDVSESMKTKDDLPQDNLPYEKLPTRTDKLLALLQNQDVNFFGRIEKTNPILVQRLARGLDEEFIYFDGQGRTYTKAEHTELEEKMKQPGFNMESLPKSRPLVPALQRHWLAPNANPNAKVETPDDLNKDDLARFEKMIAHNKKLAANRFFSDTNLGEAVLNTLKREMNNMVQGIVIFTDGRSTEGNSAVFEEVAERAKAAHIPIFVVGIGEERPQIRLEITDLRAPQQVQPEDKFHVVLEVTGEGLAGEEFPAALELTYKRKKDNGMEEDLDIYLREKEDKKDPKRQRAEISLGPKLLLTPEKPPKFDNSNPPRVEIEYTVDALALAAAAQKLDALNQPEFKNKKWEIGETKDGEFHLQARVPKDKREIFADKEHKSDIVDLRVVKRPIRVLLFAGAASHDFQFVNNMFIREVEQQRAELSLYIQPPAGKDPAEWRKGVVLGVKPERFLAAFPDKLDQPVEKPEDKVYDLNEYDVIVAFDPDWSKLSDDQLKLVNKWCEKVGGGGGLIMLGGPINTVKLARPGEYRDKLRPILDMLPVVLRDVRLESLDRTTENPWPLWFEGATPDMEFLKLAEETDKGPPPFLADWNEFFYGKDGKGIVKRGFYNYYPSESVKTGSLIVARFMDPRAKMKDGSQMPYIVLSDPASGRRVVWIAWGETRRLRQHSEAYHERFWTKLVRYAGAGSQTNLNKRIHIDMNRIFTAGRFVQIDARIDGQGGQPLMPRKDDQMPRVTLKLPAGSAENIPTKYKMTPKKSKDDSDKGKFGLRFQVKSPGDYQLELEVPETGDSIIQKFSVKESNPELDNTRPDFDTMYPLASDANQVLLRMPEADRLELKRHLVPPKLEKKSDEKSADKAAADSKMRLFFNLKNAQLIPSCMVAETKTQQNRGQYKDVWDADWDIGGFFQAWHIPGWLRNGLVVIVGLLSLEWLIRKLLRLA
jgi:von Willebrand factor type A domain